MNIFDLYGPEFLRVYAVLLIAGIVATVFLRRRLLGGDADVDVRSIELQPFDVALLAEGDQHAVRTALAGLAHRELITVESKSRTIRATDQPAAGAADVERRVHESLGKSPMRFEEVVRRTGTLVAQARARLQHSGLLVGDDERRRLRFLPVMVLGVVLAIGLIKINIGVARGRPVGDLSIFCWATVIVMALMAFVAPRRSHAGTATLNTLRSRNMGLRQTVVAKPTRVAPNDFSLAVALYGAAIIKTGPLATLRTVLRPTPSDDRTTGSGCSSSSSGSSCSSGGCGGGCGGGGCGGCGS